LSLLLQLSLSTKLEGDETKFGEDSMRFYNNQHNYYCGIDLHARLLYVCILDSLGNKVLHKKIDADLDALLELITHG
jgi:hypothetical protein